jgi:hypothetical protein
LRNVVKYRKYSLAKFAHFQYVSITCGNCYHFPIANFNPQSLLFTLPWQHDVTIYMAYFNQKNRFSVEISTMTYLFIAENKLLWHFRYFLKVIWKSPVQFLRNWISAFPKAKGRFPLRPYRIYRSVSVSMRRLKRGL